MMILAAGLKLRDPATATEPETPEAEEGFEEAYRYAYSTEKRLEEAGRRYEALRKRGLVQVSWQDLSFIEKQAFSQIPAAGLVVTSRATVMKQFQGAVERLEKRRDKFEHPSAQDSTDFAAATRSLILLKALKKGGDLNKTGRIVGIFSELGGTTFADWDPVLGSTASKRLNQALNDLKSSLTSLSTDMNEGRPSNFRLKLQEVLLPVFRKSMSENYRDVDTLISKLESAIRSTFSIARQAKSVVPQRYVRMAREAGIKNIKADQKNYPWIDPNAALAEDLPVTKKGVLEALGLEGYSLSDVEDLIVGRMLPRDAKGKLWQKVSKTQVQQVYQGKRVGDKYLIKDMFEPPARQ
jgi:hypothetical protein